MLWLQHAGWWKAQPDQLTPQVKLSFDRSLGTAEFPLKPGSASFYGDPNEFPYYLLLFPSPNLGDGSAANRPMLQETPDPMTTVMWNSWVEMNPQRARELGTRTAKSFTSPPRPAKWKPWSTSTARSIPIYLPYRWDRDIPPLAGTPRSEASPLWSCSSMSKMAPAAWRAWEPVSKLPPGKQGRLTRYESGAGDDLQRSLFGGS